ncbi:sulfite exporter TauE/SafE family protein [Pseudonocardia spinosispora]|uniref:sulfite exporter TauE/SafE family protein n=1 Tax=Pseudonocardia spinosispora TaxID=103441 RepID=UPI0003F7B498|nr:TSUP family transporter [Pseudonocardia spinosispora]
MNTPLDWAGFGAVTPLALAVLCVAAFVAGAVDAIVGGGGLVQLPAMLLFSPGGAAVHSLATNKVASVFGTASAAVGYARRVRIDWAHALPMALIALCGALGGARLAAALPSKILTIVVLVALIAVGLYIWRRPELGVVHAPRFARHHQLLAMCAGGLLIGFWDGLAGPGTGSFLVFWLVAVVGFGFLDASATSKIVNTATNFGALLFFVPAGVVLVGLGVVMALCNVAGSLIGARLAIRKGTGFVRTVFLVVVCALILSLVWKIVRAG